MAYLFYMGGVLLPVTPGSLQVKIKNQNKTITLINEGEINLLKSAGLTELSFTAMLPHMRYPFANTYRPVEDYLGLFEKLKVEKKPFIFLCTRVSPGGGTLFDTNMRVTLEEYTITEDAAKTGLDTDVQIKLKQFRDYGTKIVNVTESGGAQTATVEEQRETDSAPDKKSYTTTGTETLWNIAKQYLGDGSRYTEIMALNPGKIINPNLILAGVVLALPPREAVNK